MDVSDALVTFHGTSAIEYACLGKPVLVADKGWYHDAGFVLFPKSRDNYLELLKTNWYDNFNIEETKSKAKLFAGAYFCIPDWQKNALLPDDVDRKILRKVLPKFVLKNKSIIKKEILLIEEWLASESLDYNTYKLIKSKKNIVPEIILS